MDVLLRYIGGGKLFGICSNLFNVLEYAADREEIAHAVHELKNSGALSALMTGSGSAVFGVSPISLPHKQPQKSCQAGAISAFVSL